MTTDTEATVLYGQEGPVATITLNRPERLNAITSPMLAALADALQRADTDSSVRTVVLTGAGRGFCSGLDLKQAMSGEGIGGNLSQAGAQSVKTEGLPTTILFNMDTPVIAMLNGPAAGYGLDLALGCDMRLMARSAVLSTGFAKVGVVPESGGTWYLPRLLGWAKACEVGFLGRDLTSEESLELGLVNRVVADEELADLTYSWASEIAANAPLAIAAMKRMFRHGLTEDFPSHTHHVLLQTILLFQSQDFMEGVTARMERRPPNFQGR